MTSSSARAAEPPGTIELRDRFEAVDRVHFFFPPSTSFNEVEYRVYAAALNARLPVHGIYQEDEGPAREVVLVTTLARPTGRLSVTVPGSTLQALDLFGQSRFILRVPRGADVEGLARQRSWDLFSERFEILSAGDLRYRIHVSDLLLRLSLGTAMLLLVPFLLARVYALHLARGRVDDIEKVHLLSRTMVLGTLLMPGIGLVFAYVAGFTSDAMLVLGEFWPQTMRWPPVMVPLTFGAVGASIWLPLVGLIWGIGPTYRRLRRVEPRGRRRRAVPRLAMILLPFGLAGLVLQALPQAAVSNSFVRIAVLLGLPLLLLKISGVIVFVVRTRPLGEPIKSRFAALRQRLGVAVGDVLVLPGGPAAEANAAVARVAPGWTALVVTDRLLDALDEEELAAVLAHELGHVKRGDLASRLRLSRLIWVFAVLGVVLLTAMTDTAGIGGVVATTVGVLLLVLVPTIVVGPFAMNQEYRADRYAAAAVGATPMMRALEKLADLNMMKRRTGHTWNLMRHHPGIHERLERLRDFAATGALEPGVPGLSASHGERPASPGAP